MKSVKIYSIHFDRPEFILWQYDSFKCHLKDNFEYIVVNNAKENVFRSKINEICTQLNIQCIETYSNSGLAGKHHADSLNYIWKNYAIKDNYVIMLDGDCFLIKELSINDFMKNYILAGPKQQRNYKYHYLTATIIIADIDSLPNCETIDWEGIGVMEDNTEIRLDTGGGIYLYYCKHPEIKEKTKELKSSWSIKREHKNTHCFPDEIINDYDEKYNVEFFGNEFLHYCKSSNWDYQTEEHHINKSKFIKNFIYKTISAELVAKEHNFQMDYKIYFGWGK